MFSHYLFLADITIGSQGEPMMDALPHVFPLYFPDGDYHRISRRTDGVSGKGYVWTIFRLVIRHAVVTCEMAVGRATRGRFSPHHDDFRLLIRHAVVTCEMAVGRWCLISELRLVSDRRWRRRWRRIHVARPSDHP